MINNFPGPSWLPSAIRDSDELLILEECVISFGIVRAHSLRSNINDRDGSIFHGCVGVPIIAATMLSRAVCSAFGNAFNMNMWTNVAFSESGYPKGVGLSFAKRQPGPGGDNGRGDQLLRGLRSNGHKNNNMNNMNKICVCEGG